jgi:N-acetyl-gamma-glutamyl-phosphate reductase
LIRVSILGATGYSGGELIRLLLNHPHVKITHVTSESSPGQPVEAAHPSLRGRVSLTFEALSPRDMASDTDVVFSCYPAGVGISPIVQFLKAGAKVIDLSADFRLPTASLYKTWYKISHSAPAYLKKAAYGLPELFRHDIKKASLIANPGCYATAAILSAAPLLRAKAVDPVSFIVDAKSGVSGAGKKVSAMYMYTEVDENLQAYGVANHRHQPEIETVLKRVGKTMPRVTFTPHLIPMKRGILSVSYATLRKSMATSDIRALFVNAYEQEPFVRVLPDGELPQTKNVTHTNYCDIGITQDKRSKRVIVIAALDNLVKGAAGQAVQNMNLCTNRLETEGLL